MESGKSLTEFIGSGLRPSSGGDVDDTAQVWVVDEALVFLLGLGCMDSGKK